MSERMKDLDQPITTSEETPPESKMKLFTNYLLETLKEMYRSLRYPEFKFAISGIITTVVLALISLLFFVLPFLINEGNPIVLATFSIPPNLIGILISIVIALLVIYSWFLLGLKVTPRAAHYLVDNKALKLVFTRGDVHYLEYIPVEKRKIALPHILNKYIALLIAWVSVSAFLLNLIAGIIAEGNPTGIVSPGDDIFAFIIREIVLFIFVPIVFTLIYPLGWMLVDAKLKAYNSRTKLNWLVGQKVLNLTAGIVTLGSLVALGADVLTQFTDRAQLMVDLVIFCFINVSLIVTLIALFYNVFFQGKFYQMITESIEVGFGITSVTLTDEDGAPLPEPEEKFEPEESPSEPVVTPEPKPEIESEYESEIEDDTEPVSEFDSEEE